MIERVITSHARTRMNHSDSLPRVHGRRLGEKRTLCGRGRNIQRYDGRPFDPSAPRVCPDCAKIARKEKR